MQFCLATFQAQSLQYYVRVEQFLLCAFVCLESCTENVTGRIVRLFSKIGTMEIRKLHVVEMMCFLD